MELLLAILFLLICILLIIVVLLQKGKGQGLSGALGGMGQSAFGTRVGDVFTWITIVLAGVFLLLAIVSTRYFHPAAQTLDPPIFQPADGTEIIKQTYIQIRAREVDEIRYTNDGSEPDRGSFKYYSGVRVKPGDVIKARAYRSGWIPSDVAVAAYPLARAAKPEFNPAPGEIKKPVKVTITTSEADATIYYTLDGSEPTEESAVYAAVIEVKPGMTVKARAFRQGRRGSEVAVGEYLSEKPSGTSLPTTGPVAP